jgi:acetyl esterase
MTLRTRVERAAARAFVRLPPAVLRPIVGAPRRSPEGFVLDGQVQALVWLMTLRDGKGLQGRGLGRSRRQIDHNGSLLSPRVADVTIEDRHVAGGAGELKARLYTPEAARGTDAPGLVWFHGGGFTIGSIESTDGICRALASEAGVVVVSVDYRLAPEHPFPAAPEDAIAATKAILADAAAWGMNPRAIAVGGDSAGANLSAVTTLALRGAAAQPAFQFLIYPPTDFTRSAASHGLFADQGLVLTRDTMDWFTSSYLPKSDLVRDPRASCLFAHDLTGLPPALVITAGFDPLRDEGQAYADRMREAGVAVEHLCAEACVHGFFNMAGSLREPSRVFSLAARKLRQALSAR